MPKNKKIIADADDTCPIVKCLTWMFSIVFIVAGILMFQDSLAMAISYLLAGALLLPPLGRVIDKRLKKWALVIVFIIMSVIVIQSLSGLVMPSLPH